MRNTVFILPLFVIFSCTTISEEKDIHLIADFDSKTIDTTGEYMVLHSLWDNEFAQIVPDPDNPELPNNVFMWEKSPEGQLWGGFILRLYDDQGIDLTTWEKLKFRIRSTESFSTVSVKLQKPHEIGVFNGEATIDGKANIWNDIEIDLTGIIAPHNNPSYFMFFPGGGEDINTRFYIDDIRLERPKLIAVSEIALKSGELQLQKGEFLQLSPTFLPKDATNTILAKWKSLNDDVVLVSSTGLIAVVGKGEALVTVEVAGVEASIKIVSE
jgi:hypothetical protein